MTEFLDPDHEIMGDAAGDLIDPDLDPITDDAGADDAGAVDPGADDAAGADPDAGAGGTADVDGGSGERDTRTDLAG